MQWQRSNWWFLVSVACLVVLLQAIGCAGVQIEPDPACEEAVIVNSGFDPVGRTLMVAAWCGLAAANPDMKGLMTQVAEQALIAAESGNLRQVLLHLTAAFQAWGGERYGPLALGALLILDNLQIQGELHPCDREFLVKLCRDLVFLVK
jgi:hypothetical protein